MVRVHEFLSDERGSESVQFILFVPLFAVLMIVVTDATILYQTHSEMWNVARDTARRMAARQLNSVAEAEAYAATQLTMFANAYEVAATYDLDGDMTVTIDVPIVDGMIFGNFLGPVLSGSLRSYVKMRTEPDPNAPPPAPGT